MVYALSIDDDQKLAAYGIQHSLLYHHQDSAKKKEQKHKHKHISFSQKLKEWRDVLEVHIDERCGKKQPLFMRRQSSFLIYTSQILIRWRQKD